MKTCYILRGVPGSGKSTYAKHLVRSGGAIHSTDDYFTVDGVHKYDVRRLRDFHDFNFTNFQKSMRKGLETLVVDNTNIRLFEFERYGWFAKACGYIVEVLEFRPDPYVAWSRNIHGVPLYKVLQMDQNFEAIPQNLLKFFSVSRP